MVGDSSLPQLHCSKVISSSYYYFPSCIASFTKFLKCQPGSSPGFRFLFLFK